MSDQTTAEIMADLRLHSNLHPIMLYAADRLAELDAVRPPCPTCGGTKLVDEGEANNVGLKWQTTCPDCVDGKVSIEQLVATYNAVMADGALPRNHHLRRVKP